MHRSLLAGIGALFAALGLGCGDKTELAESPDAVPVGSPDASHQFARASVARFDDFVGDFIVDEERQLSVLLGRSYQTLVSVCTTGEDNPDTGRIQIVQKDSSIHVLTRARDINIVVWSQILPPDDCGLFLSTTPLATGTVHYVQQVSARAETGQFRLKVRFEGTAVGMETSQRYRVGFTALIQVTPTGQVHFSGGDIRLTPIGG